MAISPRHKRSATSRTSSGTVVVGCGGRLDLVEHQGPRHVDPEEHDEREEDGFDTDGRPEIPGPAWRDGHDHDEDVENDRCRRLEPPQPARGVGIGENWR